MKFLSIGIAALLPLVPLTNDFAKYDITKSALRIADSGITIVNSNNKNIADIYSLAVYFEEEINELSPIQVISTTSVFNSSKEVNFPNKFQKTEPYSSTKILEEQLKLSSNNSISFSHLESLQEIAANHSSYTYRSSLLPIKDDSFPEISFTVDGKENKFAIYAYVINAVSLNRFYIKYNHKRYNNYNQQELYKTLLYSESADCHIYLPKHPTRNLIQVYYFENDEEYKKFLEKRNLKNHHSFF